ncbi:hypothetical protein PAPYR_5648 [Paratrimastix pyriformis]|uniref:Transmembrane protein 138 n=1 Tax=Paratrimastix pyriformis TaxID=342808 RepID=A0ABQ8UHF0_9EUKA|nr:hypothetical protein PAPYR_5648 [Paratrimastix pyriformis]
MANLLLGKLLLIYALLVVDLLFNAWYPQLDFTSMVSFIFSFVPTWSFVLVFILFLSMFWTMFPFRMGMLQKVISEFRVTFLVWLVNLGMQIISRVVMMILVLTGSGELLWSLAGYHVLHVFTRLGFLGHILLRHHRGHLPGLRTEVLRGRFLETPFGTVTTAP